MNDREILARQLKVGELCLPRVTFVGISGSREPMPCRVEQIGRTSVQLKEIFGIYFWIGEDLPCRLLTNS